MDDLLFQTYRLLKKNWNFNKYPKVNVNPTRIRVSLGSSGIPTKIHDSIFYIIVFSTLDALVDFKYPNLSEKNFTKKYQNLKADTKLNHIFKETYRILRLIRNSAVHNSIERKDGLKIKYNENNIKYILDCSKSSLEYLELLCLLFIQYPNTEDKYFEVLIRSCFSKVVEGVEKFSDNHQYDFKKLVVEKNQFLISPRYRYLISIDILSKPVTIEKKENKWSDFCQDCNTDYDLDEYLISANTKKYLIPGYLIEETRAVSWQELEPWVVTDNFFDPSNNDY